MSNSIMTLELYRQHGNWVFDDEQFGLVAEAFVSGMSEIIDKLIYDKYGIIIYENKYIITISSTGFPDYDNVITRMRTGDDTGWLEEFGGNWYELAMYDMQGWLCPALFHYFDDAPLEIYAKVETV